MNIENYCKAFPEENPRAFTEIPMYAKVIATEMIKLTTTAAFKPHPLFKDNYALCTMVDFSLSPIIGKYPFHLCLRSRDNVS